MSDYITFEIQEEIIKRLPVRSLVRCRSVSKSWKALIDGPKFITSYSVSQTHAHHLLISYTARVSIVDDDPFHEYDERYVSIVDDDTFPQKKFAPTLPFSIKILDYTQVVGNSGGLLCFYGYYPNPDHPDPNRGKQMAVLWNPFIRKSVIINVPDVKYWEVSTRPILGFGVCPVTSDSKIVKITQYDKWWESEGNENMPWKVKVYTLSSGEWRTLSCNLPMQSIQVRWDQVVIDRFIYWVGWYRIAINDGFRTTNTIMSFDMVTDEFREAYLPDSLTYPSDDEMNTSRDEITISKLWESLAVLEYRMDVDKRICVVWMMEHGVPKSFTKLFTIKAPHASIYALGFRKSGEPIIEVRDYPKSNPTRPPLLVYEPYSEHTNDLWINGIGGSFSVYSYIETLLLLNQ